MADSYWHQYVIFNRKMLSIIADNDLVLCCGQHPYADPKILIGVMSVNIRFIEGFRWYIKGIKEFSDHMVVGTDSGQCRTCRISTVAHGHVLGTGTSIPGGRNFATMMTEDSDKVVVIKLSGLFHYCCVALPGMRARKDGLINMEECAPGCCTGTASTWAAWKHPRPRSLWPRLS